MNFKAGRLLAFFQRFMPCQVASLSCFHAFLHVYFKHFVGIAFFLPDPDPAKRSEGSDRIRILIRGCHRVVNRTPYFTTTHCKKIVEKVILPVNFFKLIYTVFFFYQ